MDTVSRKFSKYSIYLTFFLDNLGLGIIFPIFTPLFFDPKYHFLKNPTSVSESSILLGLLIAFFPLAQFFGAPLIGDLSDQIGRKKAFTLSILGSIIGYICMGIAIDTHSVKLLFLSRMFSGFFAGNLTICLASLVDMSHDKIERAKNFSLLATFGGLSFISSVSIGGFFSNPDKGKYFGPSLPFFIIATLFIVNLLFILAFFKESHQTPSTSQFSFLKGIHNIIHAWRLPTLKKAYLVFFFYMTAWITSVQFFPTYLIKYYAVTTMHITYIYVGIGLAWGASNFIFSRFLANVITPRKTLFGSLFLLSTFIFFFIFLTDLPFPIFLLCFYPAVALSAVSWSNCITNVSLQAADEMQGRILGINQSFAALAAILGPISGGFIAGFDPKLIYLTASIFCMVAFIILLSSHFKKEAVL
ncbi:MAG: MFS transporter [Chlamydiae bacterium]|nr:MFS transporter [Chlamydiota bacterium]